jgi:hypothetical protein
VHSENASLRDYARIVALRVNRKRASIVPELLTSSKLVRLLARTALIRQPVVKTQILT